VLKGASRLLLYSQAPFPYPIRFQDPKVAEMSLLTKPILPVRI
jgi:hypothetical protein